MTKKAVLSGFIMFLLASAMIASPVMSADAPKADVAFPDPSTKWVTLTANQLDGSTTEQTWTVVEVSYENRAVVGFSDGTITSVHNKTNRNWIANLSYGREETSASPDDGTFSWPLEVGKSWTASYIYRDHVQGKVFNPVTATWKVTAYEDVTVPAGTFKAFRLESFPGRNMGTTFTLWWAPEVKLIVKRVTERTRSYRGGKFTTELVKIEKTEPVKAEK